jgi:hypothetical protein
MLSECFNPACRKELRYLRSGKVVMALRQGVDRIEAEHFWLCGACYVSYDFRFGEDGNPSLITKSPVQIAKDLDHWLGGNSTTPTQPAALALEFPSEGDQHGNERGETPSTSEKHDAVGRVHDSH